MEKVTYYYDYLNPTSKDNPEWFYVPAFRGENQLNIYTYEYQYKTKEGLTGTNPWGKEAAVNRKGEVISISDRVKIPKGGFVISGNSKGNEFISNNVKLGSTIKIDLNIHSIIVYTDETKSMMITFNSNLNSVKKSIKKAQKHAYLLNYKQIDEYLLKVNNLKKELLKNKNNIKKFKNLFKKSESLFNRLYLLCSNSRMISSRASWERPMSRDLASLRARLDIMKKCHLNAFFVESFYNGNIPGISEITETSEEVRGCSYGEYGNDYLLALISEAHKRNIEVHAWVECFFIGEKSSQWKKRYPDSWHMVNYNGSFIQGKGDGNAELVENDFIWIDPANPECHKYVMSIYKELLTKYDFDGINVDYIRYPHGNYKLETSNGYTEYAMNEFKKINNLEGDVKELVKNPEINSLWTKYRCSKISQLMSEIHELVSSLNKKCLVSMAVISETDYAIKNKMQDWVPWVKKGYIDITFPMAYYFGCSEVANATKELVKFNDEKAFSYTGIAPYYQDGDPMLAVKQINTIYENGAEGYNLFCTEHIFNSKFAQRSLQIGPNRYQSTQPHEDYHKVCKAFAKEFALKRDHYLYFFNEDEQMLNYIQNQVNYLSKSKDIEDCLNNAEVIKALVKMHFNKHSQLAFLNDLKYLTHILNIQEYIVEK